MSPAPERALAIGAHPDDCDFGAGATLAAWAAAGTRATILVLTDGTKGSHDPEILDAALRATREAEQRAAAAHLGVSEVRFLRAIDGALTRTPELVRAAATAIRELQPQVVLTHDPWSRYDLHPDHPVAGQIVVAALFQAREPRAARDLAAAGLAPWRPRELWLWQAAEPDHAEPAGDAAFSAKLDALLAHTSQLRTSMGLDPEAPDRAGLAARLDAWARAGGPDGARAERFRRLALPG